MKRFAPLALVVLALALVPVAFGDDGNPAPTQPTAAPAAQTAQQGAGHSGARLRVELLRLRLQIVRLRFRLHCGPNGKASHDQCTAFAQKVEDRLTKLDGNVQSMIADLKACASSSTDSKCKNADKKIELLTGIDTRLQSAIQEVQDWLNGKSSGTASAPSSPAAGSNG